MENAHGILIRKTRLSDTSLIIHWASVERGLVKTVARGALRNKSAFTGKLDLFFTAEIAYVRSSRSELHVLREVQVTNNRNGLRSSYLQTLAASYFVKLVELLVELETPIPEQLSLLERGLNYLCENRPGTKEILFFEKELSKTLDVYDATKAPIDSLTALHSGGYPKMRAEVFKQLANSG